MKYIAKAASILLGALILGLVVLAWGLATNGIASYIERAWCRNVGLFRGLPFPRSLDISRLVHRRHN